MAISVGKIEMGVSVPLQDGKFVGIPEVDGKNYIIQFWTFYGVSIEWCQVIHNYIYTPMLSKAIVALLFFKPSNLCT